MDELTDLACGFWLESLIPGLGVGSGSFIGSGRSFLLDCATSRRLEREFEQSQYRGFRRNS